MNLREQIKNFKPFNEQEIVDKEYYIKFIDTFNDVLTRNNQFGHFTSSAFIVNKERNKMLVVYHKILNGWIYPGGHADGDENLLYVALKETKEETGLDVKILDKNIFAINSIPILGHIKNNKYVPAHTHFDVVYIFEADDKEKLIYREDESNGIKWIDFKDVSNKNTVDSVKEIHKKLVKKLNSTNIYLK